VGWGTLGDCDNTKGMRTKHAAVRFERVRVCAARHFAHL
jgi:hypothetical protein